MDPDYFDQPPSYARLSKCSSPTYSVTPSLHERVLRPRPTSRSTESQEYVYHTTAAEINLGLPVWGTSTPAYGAGTSVDGTVTLAGNPKSVSSIRVDLKGTAVATLTERGHIAGAEKAVLMFSEHVFNSPASGDWTTRHAFSLPFPTYAGGRRSLLPPSTVAYQPGMACDVNYRLKVTIVRKGLRRNDSLRVPILYLPRTYSKAPLIRSIPDVVDDSTIPTLVSNLEEVKIIRLRSSYKASPLSNCSLAVVLALPSALSFPCNEPIPLTLSIMSPETPATIKLLLSVIDVKLVKYTQICAQKGNIKRSSESVVGVADITHISESRKGVCTVHCMLGAAQPILQQTWNIEDIFEQNYFIRVCIFPPPSVASHIPCFTHEEPVELTTDACDSSEHILLSLGVDGAPGIISPAIGMYGNLRSL